MHPYTRIKRIGLALIALSGLAMVAPACTNPEVPAGHEGYVYYIPLIFGKQEYRKSLRGPASTGMSWRLHVINIDMRQRTYKEKFKLLTADNLSVSFEVSTEIKLRDGQVKAIVEKWGGPHWYDWRVKEVLRTAVRRAVADQHADQLQAKTHDIAQNIRKALTKRYENTPIEVRGVAIGHLEFPKRYDRAIQQKVAKTEELKRMAAELLKTEEEAKTKVVNALNVARAQRIISESLSPLYVQYRAVQVYKKLANSKNKAIMLLPNTNDGTGLPMVLTKQAQLRVLSAKDKQYLDEMEAKHYDKKTLKEMRAAVKRLQDEIKREQKRSSKGSNGALDKTPAPGKPGGGKPSNPDTKQPDTKQPDTKQPDTKQPDTKPAADKPATPAAKTP